MTHTPRFLQIHTLTPYVGALLNRDQAGHAKRLTYGGSIRTRISSQCLKRHWRMAEDVHAINTIGGPDAMRTRHAIEVHVASHAPENLSEEERDYLATEVTKQVYGDKGGSIKSRQVLLIGHPEIKHMQEQIVLLAESLSADELAALTDSGKKSATKSDTEAAAGKLKAWKANFKKTAAEMREVTAMPAGVTGALFGRMVTSDTDANITAPVHVAHAFTTHADETESDYFVAVDDLNDNGTATIQDTELTSGLYYGYVVIDLPQLLENCGQAQDAEGAQDLAMEIIHNLIYLIAEVSPGAKRGSTAPYARPVHMLVEAGYRQPRSLAEAFRKDLAPDRDIAIDAFNNHLQRCDDLYQTGETRIAMSIKETPVPNATSGGLSDLARFAAEVVRQTASIEQEPA